MRSRSLRRIALLIRISRLEKLAALESVVTANLSLQATVDVAISSELVLILRTSYGYSRISVILSYSFSKSKTTFKRTDRVLNRLIRGAVQSGLFTCTESYNGHDACIWHSSFLLGSHLRPRYIIFLSFLPGNLHAGIICHTNWSDLYPCKCAP